MNLNILCILLFIAIIIYLIFIVIKYTNKNNVKYSNKIELNIILFFLLLLIVIILYYYIYVYKLQKEKFDNHFTNDACCNEDQIQNCQKYGKIGVCNENNKCVCQSIE